MRIYQKWYRILIRLILILIFTIVFAEVFDRRIFMKKRGVKMIYRSQEAINNELETLLEDLVIHEKSRGCEMPVLDPFSEEVTQFDTDFEAVACNNEGDDWVECHLSMCNTRQTILRRMRDLTCIYKDLIYLDDEHYYFGKPVKVKGDAEYFLNASDYVKVNCSGVEVSSQKRLKWYGRKAGFRPLPIAAPQTNSINVLLLVIDSTSRSTFMRRMPISYNVLKKELQAIVMENYNIVGESTVGSMMPILTGHHEFEMPDWRKRPTNTRRIDPELFLFSLLNGRGYRTAFFEDMPWFHTFNYRFNGFDYRPSDHYTRPLFQDLAWASQGKNSTNREDYCFGSESLFKFMVEYSAKLFELGGKKFCVTISGTFSHDNINALTMIDEDLAIFLRMFKRQGHLKNTVLFVMSDHGSRMYPIKNTYQGRIEEYLPFVSIVLPWKLVRARPNALLNLVSNSKVLTTPFDVHTTILDALGLKNLRNKYKVPGTNLERGISLLEPMLKTRSCGEAGIMPHFCACARWQKVIARDIAYTRVALELARFINDITDQVREKCDRRDLLSIAGVYRLGPMIDLLEFTTKSNTSSRDGSSRHRQNLHQRLRAHSEYYQVKVVMDPGEAIFEGSMVYNVKDDSFKIFDKDISRIDRYGNESRCVGHTHPHISKYCHCVA